MSDHPAPTLAPDSPTPTGTRLPRTRTTRPWLRACGALVAVAWGGNEFTPLLVMYRHEGLGSVAVNALLGAYVLGIVPALLIGGPLSDRFGRRPLMLPAPLICIAGSTLLALGPHVQVLLYAGRVLSGIALGLVMAVGTSWVKELSQPPFEDSTDDGLGARRASLALTAGFGLGAAVAAALAQFGPAPTALPYVVNIVITLALSTLMLSVPETRPRVTAPGRLRDDLRVPAARHRRFLLVVLPAAPWVFGVAASAYAILPVLVAHQVPGYETAFSGLLCFIGLGCGFITQHLAKRFDTPHSSRAVAVALGVTVAGMVLAVWASTTLSILATLVTTAVLGSAYGLLLVSGLMEAQRVANPDGLAGVVAVFYSLAYIGFFIPVLLATLADVFTYPQMFAGGAVIAAGCLAVVVSSWRRHLPQPLVDDDVPARVLTGATPGR